MKAATITLAMGLVAAAPCAVQAAVFEVGPGGVLADRTSGQSLIDVPAVGTDQGDQEPDPAPDIPAIALTTIDPPAVPVAFEKPLSQAAQSARVSPALLAALVWQESRWHASAVSPKGARGLTQLMPGTARALAVDPADAASNLAGGARYLRAMLDMFDGNVERALAAYNAGPGRVLRSNGLPGIAETRAYVSSIIDHVGLSATSPLGGEKP